MSESLSTDALPGKFTELDGMKIWNVVLGSGEPILFLHGIPTSSFLWRNIQKPLAADFTTLAPDLIGLGASDGPARHSFKFEDQADTLLALLDHYGHERIVLVAHDVGGGVAQYFCNKYPERVRALVLMNVVAYSKYWPVTTVKLMRLPLLGSLMGSLPGGFVRFLMKRQIRKGIFHKTRFNEKICSEYYRRIETPEGRLDFLKFVKAFEPRALDKIMEQNAELNIPILLLWGENDQFQPLDEGKQIFENFRSVKFVRLKEAGHFLQEDQPQRIVDEIHKFLDRIP